MSYTRRRKYSYIVIAICCTVLIVNMVIGSFEGIDIGGNDEDIDAQISLNHIITNELSDLEETKKMEQSKSGIMDSTR